MGQGKDVEGGITVAGGPVCPAAPHPTFMAFGACLGSEVH